MTDEQKALIDQLLTALGHDPRIKSAWLSGSFGRGAGDAWSDIDLTLVVAEEHISACLADYSAPRPDMPPLAFFQTLYGRVLTAITTDWGRFDLAFLTPPELARQDGGSLRHLLGDPTKPAERPGPSASDAPARLSALIAEFLRVLGLAPVAFGREEWIVARQGVELLRNMTVDLMVEEAGLAPAARGVKRLNPFLTPGQRQVLEALPSPPPEPEALMQAQVAIAAVFLSRARPLAAKLGANWPTALEEATRRHLRAALDFDLP